MRSLTRTATTGIVEDISALIDYVVQHLSSKTYVTLDNNAVDTTVISQVREIFPVLLQSPLKGCTLSYNTIFTISTLL